MLLSACSGSGASADGRKLTAQSFLNEEAASGKAAGWLFEEIEGRTDGALAMDVYWDGSLIEATGIKDALGDGRLDVGQATHAYNPDEFPLTNITSLPFVTSNVAAQSAAMTELYRTNDAMAAEWEEQGLHLVAFLATPPAVLGTSEPITEIGQLEGAKIRANDRFVQTLQSVDSNPVALTAFETYEALDRGVVDGFTGIPLDIAASMQLQEVAPHLLDSGQGNYGGGYIAMGLDVWEELSEEQQQTIEEVADELPQKLADYYQEIDRAACETFVEAGSVRALPDAEVDEWKDAIGDSVQKSWATAAADSGVDTQAFLEEYLTLIEREEAEYSGAVNGLAACATDQGNQ